MGGRKKSSAEVEAITNQICIAMIKGYTRRSDILQYVSKMDKLSPKERNEVGWIRIGSTIRTIDEYIKRATDSFKKISKENIEDERALRLAQLTDMYREAREKKLLRDANAIMRNIIFVSGLGEIGLKDTTGDKKEETTITLKDSESRVEKMINILKTIKGIGDEQVPQKPD